MRRIAIASIAVFFAWAVLDFVIHGVLLGATYASQPELWRPQAEMDIALIYVSVAVAAVAFCWIYGALVSPRSMTVGVKYGIAWGIGLGVGMGYGTYAVMPIPYPMALTWFLGTVVEAAVAGVLVGAIIKG